MSEGPEPFVDLTPPVAEPVELYCPSCGYNLTGTVEDRCSECGRSFNRAGLIEWTTGQRQRLPFGSLALLTPSLFRLSLFSPSQLGRLLPPHPDTESAKIYSLRMRLLAGGIIPLVFMAVMAGITRDGGSLLVIFLFPLPIALASGACEAVIAGLLTRFVDARAVERSARYRFWRTLCRCFCGHLPVSLMLWILSYGIMLALPYPTNAIVEVSLYLAAACCILWWWHCLGRAIIARGAPSAARTVIVWLIPVIGLAALGLGISLFLLEAFFVDAVCV